MGENNVTVKKQVFHTHRSVRVPPRRPEQTRVGVTAVERTEGITFRPPEGMSRLQLPLEAERRREKLLYGTHDGASSVRKMRRPGRDLSLKPAPKVVTAPRDPNTIRRRFVLSQLTEQVKSMDILLFGVVAALALIGVLSVFSATRSYETNRFLIIQTGVAVVGLFAAAVMSFLDYRQLLPKARAVLIVNGLLLLITVIFGEGVTGSTNENWLDLGVIKVQPSEFAKVLFIISFAAHLSLFRKKAGRLLPTAVLFAHAALVMGLVYLQKDDGTLTVFLMIFAVMCFAGGLPMRYFIAGAAGVAVLLPFLWKKLDGYQRDRILVLFDDTVDPNAVGVRMHAARSMEAIRGGGIAGSGYRHGSITQGNLFAKHTDMIFSTICEEWGMIGGLVLIGLYVLLVVCIVRTALSCKNLFGCLICFGVAAMFSAQIIENLGMCLGITPVIGITLPFVSYGGSSALSAYLAIGLVLSISAHRERTFFGG